MSASRLPGKPLLKINGISIIQHVYNKAKATNLGKVYVATEDAEIQTEIEKNGGNSIMTSKNHQTGTDRIFEAVEKIKVIDILVNNAGTNFPEPFEKIKQKSMNYLVDLNLKAAFNVAQLVVKKMLKNKSLYPH